MKNKNVISILLNCNLPFIRHPEVQFTYEEIPFFCTISKTLLPLLSMMEKLQDDSVPFKIALSISPTMCEMLKDEVLIKKYILWLKRQEEFGNSEIKRTANNNDFLNLATYYHTCAINNRKSFCVKYNNNILNAFAEFQKKGVLELICAPATNCFLPFYKNNKETINALLETGLVSHNISFLSGSNGILLPELGWDASLDQYLQVNKYKWTVVETHCALLSNPISKYGSFYPVKTKLGTTLFIKDFYAYNDIMDRKRGLYFDSAFLDFFADAVDELPKNDIQLFLNSKGIRIPSGYKYKAINKEIYNIELAHSKAKDLAKTFFEKRLSILNQAAENLDRSDVESGKKLISLCVWDADFFGRFFCEGTIFLENLFRVSANNKELIFMTPSEYLEDQKNQEMQTVETEFSSSNFNGYAETTIDANNDWVYRHISRSIDRMSELADRFPNETGVRERCLNQAAREIMLALSSDWPRLMSEIHSSSLPRWKSYARKRIEDHIRNFTTIYESLGSNHLNTKFLTDLEQSNTIFPQINYKVFKKNR